MAQMEEKNRGKKKKEERGCISLREERDFINK